MKKRGVILVATILIALMAAAGSVKMWSRKPTGTRLMVPARNVASAPAYWHYQSQSHRGGQALYVYLRKEDHFPVIFRALERVGLYSPDMALAVPTAHWLAVNMDDDDYFDVTRRLKMEKVEIEVISEEHCLVVDARVAPKYLRATPADVKDYPLPFDARQRYPRYFAPAAAMGKK